jgi:hypothetical protein
MLGLKNRIKHYLSMTAHDLRRDVRRDVGEDLRYESALIKEMLLRDRPIGRIREAGYRVYSQFDEDGIIQHLIRHVPIGNDLFVEIGVEDYRESNTRYLLERNDWRGVLIDCDGAAERWLRDSATSLWHTVEFVEAFVTRENVNELLSPYAGDVGLLSIDVDGVDYHLWEAIEVVSPRIVAIEYQSNFGKEHALTVPYRPDFERGKHHYTELCYGASLPALVHLAERKGYAFVGASSGINAFFVRRDAMNGLTEAKVEEEYVETRYRESRDRDHNYSYLSSIRERCEAMADGEVIDVRTGERTTIGRVFGLT